MIITLILMAGIVACFSVSMIRPSYAIAGPLHLSGASGPDGKFNVDINWFSADIGKNNTFSIRVWNASNGQEVYDGLALDFSIMQGGKELMKSHLAKPVMPADTATYSYGADYAFNDTGSYIIKISNINNSGESVEFPVQVTPEFPAGVLITSVVAVIVAMLGSFIAARSKSMI